jgi:hypothetical protein
VITPGDTTMAVVGFTSAGGRIVAIDLIADPGKLGRLSLEARRGCSCAQR